MAFGGGGHHLWKEVHWRQFHLLVIKNKHFNKNISHYNSISGSYAGAVLGIPLSGILTEYLNWQIAFYFYGNFTF